MNEFQIQYLLSAEMSLV